MMNFIMNRYMIYVNEKITTKINGISLVQISINEIFGPVPNALDSHGRPLIGCVDAKNYLEKCKMKFMMINTRDYINDNQQAIWTKFKHACTMWLNESDEIKELYKQKAITYNGKY